MISKSFDIAYILIHILFAAGPPFQTSAKFILVELRTVAVCRFATVCDVIKKATKSSLNISTVHLLF